MICSKIQKILVASLITVFHVTGWAFSYEVMHTPHQGAEAFGTIFERIETAQESVKLTVYSWSQKGLDNALETAALNGVQVRVVLHPPLVKKKAASIEHLESVGVEFKQAFQNMHEKFAVIDGEFLMNTSANYSNGAKNSYSENFVFIQNPPKGLMTQFQREFAILWDSGKDIFTHGEDIATSEGALDYPVIQDRGQAAFLVSSSSNFDFVETDKGSQAYQSGQYLKAVRRNTWVVRDEMIAAINQAQFNVYCSLNHLFLEDVEDAMIDASAAGVDVALTVDNQEFKSRVSSKTRERTPHFVKAWRALPGNADKEVPVRVKYYSHAPSPSFWKLNHHKFCVLDYDAEGAGDDAVVITGSYNISYTAEQKQFDNMVFFRGKQYETLMESFFVEFSDLWHWNRSESDEVSMADIKDRVYTEGEIKLHWKEAVSLTWEEAEEVHDHIRTEAPSFFRDLFSSFDNRNCAGYNTVTEEFWGCRRRGGGHSSN